MTNATSTATSASCIGSPRYNYCPHCGRRNSSHNYCPDCGTRLTNGLTLTPYNYPYTLGQAINCRTLVTGNTLEYGFDSAAAKVSSHQTNCLHPDD